MERTGNDTIGQLVRRHETKPTQLRGIIKRVNYLTRRLHVTVKGFGSLRHVPVQLGIELGTPDRPKVFKGDVARLELQFDVQWTCTAIVHKIRCATGSAGVEVEVDTSDSFIVSGYVTHPDDLHLPPLEQIGSLILPSDLPPPPTGGYIPCDPAQVRQPGQIMCFDDTAVPPCWYWCTPPPTPVGGDGSRIYITSNDGIAYTDNALDATPVWHDASNGLSGDALDVYWFEFDPFSAGGLLTPGLQAAYIATKDGIYKNTSLPTGVWTQVLSPAALATLIGAESGGTSQQFGRELRCAITYQGYVAMLTHRFISGVLTHYLIFSQDGGVTWSVNSSEWWENGNGYDSNGFTGFFHLYNSNKQWGLVYISAWTGRWWNHLSATADQNRFFKSVDAGGTLTDEGKWNGGSRAQQLLFPYANGSGATYPDDTKAWRYDQDNGTLADLQSTTTFPTPYDPTGWTNAGLAHDCDYLDISTFDEDFMYVIGGGTFYYSIDNGASFNTTAVGTHPLSALSALPSNSQYCVVADADSGTPGDAEVNLTLDNGVTFTDITQNLNSIRSSITGLRRVVPDSIKA